MSKQPNWSKLERERFKRDMGLYESNISPEYRRLEHGEIIEEHDEIDRCHDPWRDDPKWEQVHPSDVGQPAPDPQYPSHRQYRRRVA